MKAKSLLAAAVLTAACSAQAQVKVAISANVDYVVQAADVSSVDAIVAALYDVISGPAGKERDWGRMHSLFMPGGRLMAVSPRPDHSVAARSMTVDDYVNRNSSYLVEHGFFEHEVARTTEAFGEVVHVFSTFESRHALADAQPFARGVNSIQLYHDGTRWWIANVVWRAEDERLKLPERYLKRP